MDHPGSDEFGNFIANLSDDEGARLKALGKARIYPKGSTLFNEGDRSDHLVLIEKGRAKISYYTHDGREIILAVRGPGSLVGELSVLDGHPRSATATSLEEMRAAVIPADAFRSYLTDHPRVALVLLELVSSRLRDADRKRIEFGAYDSVGRVARRIVELAERFGEKDERGVRIALPLSQQELAGWTGSSREAVSKALQHLRARGWIETHRRGITVLDLEALSRRAE